VRSTQGSGAPIRRNIELFSTEQGKGFRRSGLAFADRKSRRSSAFGTREALEIVDLETKDKQGDRDAGTAGSA
jgi:hypothetical protein